MTEKSTNAPSGASTYKVDAYGRHARAIARHETRTGYVFVVYETAHRIEAVSEGVWATLESGDAGLFARQVAEAVGATQRAADVRRHGIDIGLECKLVKLTKTQAILENEHGTTVRYSRRTWRRVGGAAGDSLSSDAVERTIAAAAGRECVDFIEQGKAPGLLTAPESS